MGDLREKIEFVKKHLKSYPDFPKKGILFWDIFSVLQQPKIFRALSEILIQTAREINPPVECVAALDARGFLFGTLLALELNIPFVPIRKKGKLPGKVVSVSYLKEYGEDSLELQLDSIEKGQRVLIIDDLLATGGSLFAACNLIRNVGGDPFACLIIMELEDLKGREKILSNVISLIKY
ncbi:hypothetical protein JTB14_021360 [Gonioctena quinquepunctata]|nr:hypothetical protein JTB14_021360 [Gonioctena quinquepunctata]